MKLLHTLVLLFFICSTATSQNALWQYLNDNAYYLGRNVGIDIIQPTERLEVNGNVKATALRSEGIVIGSQTPEVAYQNAASSIGAYRADQSLYIQSPNDLYFHTAVTEGSLPRMTILRNGNIGVGTTNPISALHIAKVEDASINGNGGLVIGSPDDLNIVLDNNEIMARDSASLATLYLQADGGELRIHNNLSEASKIVFTENGNVGIGTTNPSQKLDVNGNIALSDGNGLIEFKEGTSRKSYISWGGRDLVIRNDESGGNININTVNDINLDSGDDVILDANDDVFVEALDDIYFRTGSGNSNRMFINELGNVGIGTTNPQQRLHVGGRMMINNGVIQRGGNPITNSNDLGLYSLVNGAWMRFVTTNARIPFFTDGGIGTTPEMVINSNGAVTINNGYNTRVLGSNVIELTVNGQADKPGGGSWISFSDRRLKKDIQPFNKGLDIIRYIKPIKYHYNGKLGIDSTPEYVGVVAQELEKVAPFMVHETTIPETGEKFLSVDPSAFDYLLINSIQEQQSQIDELLKENKNLKAGNEAIRYEVAALKQIVQQLAQQQTIENTQTSKLSDAALGQNQPNPFTESTTIQYFIPLSTKSAILQITTQGGKLIKQILIADKGHGQTILEASSLSAGVYTYSLILDGQIFETKQMILTNK